MDLLNIKLLIVDICIPLLIEKIKKEPLNVNFKGPSGTSVGSHKM